MVIKSPSPRQKIRRAFLPHPPARRKTNLAKKKLVSVLRILSRKIASQNRVRICIRASVLFLLEKLCASHRGAPAQRMRDISSFGHLDFLRKTFELCPTDTACTKYESREGPFLLCGGGGIRTPDGCNTMLPFQGSALDRYATPPCAISEQYCT